MTGRGGTASHSVQGRLILEANPALSPRLFISCFRDHRGRSIIQSFTPEGNWTRDYLASLKGGAVSLASGDLDGDGLDELVVGTTKRGIFSRAKIRVLGRNGEVLPEIPTDHRSWLRPLNVAVGDLDGDWKEEIIIGLSSREKPQEEFYGAPRWGPRTGEGMVKAYRLLEGRLVETGLRFVPFPESWAWRAPSVAIGDIDGDGKPELITAPGPTPMAPALVRIFQVETGGGEPWQWEVGPLKAELEVDFTASHGTWVGYGANVSAADLDCDGRDEVLLGAPPSPMAAGEVAVMRPEAEGEQLFLAFPEARGTYVAGWDLNQDGCAEMVVGQGSGPKAGPKVRIFRGDTVLVREWQVDCQPSELPVRVAAGALGD